MVFTNPKKLDFQLQKNQINDDMKKKGGGHSDTFKGPILFSGYRPYSLIDCDEILYGSLC